MTSASPAITLPPSVEGREVQDAYKAYTTSSDVAERNSALLRFAIAHPFIQVKTPVTHIYKDHSVTITGYQLAIFKFRKWLTKDSEGRKYKSAAGGMSDDGLYTVSPMLRALMPRGLSEVKFKPTGGGKETTVVFKGIPKFSGLVASDEDEESNASANIFFYKGKSIDNAGGFYTTAKSNGENAKLGCHIVDGIVYLIAGSKNTCFLWPAKEPVQRFQKANNPSVPGQFICALYSDWFLKLAKEQQSRFAEDMGKNYGTIMAEINTPWYEHVVPINSLYIECYCLLDVHGQPVHPREAFEFFRRFGIKQMHPTISAAPAPKKDSITKPEDLQNVVNRESWIDTINKDGAYKLDAKTTYIGHVFFSRHDIKELSTVVNSIREATNTEGAVLYLTDAKTEEVIGLVKVKASEYVIRRRLRENMKGAIFGPLRRGDIKDFPAPMPMKNKRKGGSGAVSGVKSVSGALQTAKDRIVKGARGLTHVPGHEKHWKEWAQFGTGFAEYWCRTRLLDGLDPNRILVAAVLQESKLRIASLFSEYSQQLKKSEKPK
eukprot:CAMPEP_0114510054 /NCGR_PEP_ID=MMETSP0109-20121206/13568_1 /TAXON_ID=29199 /ORGANISM="Chlorarachnion reptans, Strain CCCM449" /LENGTH=546 /DNA_ID=CAMNT_0001689307 /DNA_START=1 /DNA_END=1641 /DNA_ORIENTATION=-